MYPRFNNSGSPNPSRLPLSDVSPTMKPALFSILGLTAVVAVEAQGVFNANNNYVPPGASSRALIWDYSNSGSGPPLSKSTGRVEFLLLDGTYLTPGGRAGVPLVANGLFFINGVVVPGVPVGGTAHIIVRAWDSSTGAFWDSALERNCAPIIITGLGGGDIPPATFAMNSNFQGLQLGGPGHGCIPEPSTYALAAIGAVGVLLAARRRP